MIKNVKHLMTGTFLILVAAVAIYASRQLSTFTEIGLGPGFLPRTLAGVQFVFGSALIVSGFMSVGEPIVRWPARPLLVLVAVVFFGMSLESMGMVIAVMGLVLIACTANSEMRPVEAAILAVGSAAFSAVLFVTLLGLTIPVWPQNLWGG